MNRKLPRRVLVTAGMPNGNKPLHIGHISQFIWADFYARFMRDRIGKENVLFFSGTDGFGSSTDEKYRKLKEAGEITSTLPEYVAHFHDLQDATLNNYEIGLTRFYASCLEPALKHHTEISAFFFEKMLENGKMQKRVTEQFFDSKLGLVLNGRQVEGKCPIEGCQSEVGYADECSLGHQYNPRDLIDPKSTLSNTVPTFKEITNYYFSLDEYRENLLNIISRLKEQENTHKFMAKEMRDYLSRPAIYLKLEQKPLLEKITLNNVFERREDEKKARLELIFNNIKDRDTACDTLRENDITYTTNKALAPLRITGNTPWGVPVPQIEPETKDLTFYVWPESLWAPISFTKTYLSEAGSSEVWQDWWCHTDNEITQFIGEDNIYFYSLAEPAMFMAVNGPKNNDTPGDNELQIPNIIANKHVLFNNIKASSSGSLKAPTAQDLLEYYTAEQLRCHFLGMNVNTVAYNFKSKVVTPEDFEGTGDPVVAQGNMLTNIFNRIIRSVFYSIQSQLDGKIPNVKPSAETLAEAEKVVASYEDKALNFKFNEIMILLDEYFRKANQDWSVRSKSQDEGVKAQLIADTIHVIRTGLTLVHPIAPKSAELVKEYLRADDKIWDWAHIHETLREMYPDVTEFKHIEPKFDFFKKHPSQIN